MFCLLWQPALAHEGLQQAVKLELSQAILLAAESAA